MKSGFYFIIGNIYTFKAYIILIWHLSQVVRQKSANVLSIAFKVLNLKGYKNSGGIRVGKRTKEIII